MRHSTLFFIVVLDGEKLSVARVSESLLTSWDRGKQRCHQLLGVPELCTGSTARLPHVKVLQECTL
jgi:hypothetical protein